MPSWELFEDQDAAYRESVLPADVTARLAVEQGSSMGWDRYVGLQGKVIAMHTFGASAPASALMKKFGFTPEAVLETARGLAQGKQVMNVINRPGELATGNPLKQMEAYGQSPWLDFHPAELHRAEAAGDRRSGRAEGHHVQPGHLREGDGARTDYDEGFKALAEKGDMDALDVYEALAVQDIQAACDMMRPVYEATQQDRWLCQHRGLAVSGAAYRRDDRRGAAALEVGRSAEPDGQGAGDRQGGAGDPRR